MGLSRSELYAMALKEYLQTHRSDSITEKLDAVYSDEGSVLDLLVTSDKTGLPRDSVVNVSQIITVDKSFLTEHVNQVTEHIMLLVEDGLRGCLKSII
ncbi:MAG: type II toxin-antitoxin system PemK/MazF family toxin [Scytonematopsis contorta HA4267-MV1]|nr:type II toxin-antitoxin system PemK/MazF family toxin [Scytonematopsis contorta HA4267-MV1]